MNIETLLDQDDLVAVTMEQALEPVEGREVPLFPPTYPVADKARGHRHDTPYTLNVLRDGTHLVTLDSVQSQANRMEAVFHDGLSAYVPQIRLTAGEHTLPVTALPHRLADAAIRASDLGGEIRAAFEAFDAGDPLPIARLGPTALIYGAWDSRDTYVKIPRLIRSEIYARDVDVLTRSAQFSGSFGREELGFTEKEWTKGAKIGFAPTPSVDQHGGVIVHGPITQTATLHVGALRQLDKAAAGLGRYLMGLALGGLWHGGRNYDLRTGCWLVPDGQARVSRVSRSGERVADTLDVAAVSTALEQALSAAASLSIPVGELREATYDVKAGKALLKSAKADS